MDATLLHALFAMDVYNRGYGRHVVVPVASSGPAKLGDWTISSDSSVLEDVPGLWSDEDIGFFAQSYTLGGETVISYRGTNPDPWMPVLSDVLTGWLVGGGAPWASQAIHAVAFYRYLAQQTSAGIIANPNFALTGHSLGGGLAGLVGNIYGNRATLFDNMPFELAALNAHAFATGAAYSPTFETTEDWRVFLYGAENIPAPNRSQIAAHAIAGEILGYVGLRALQQTPVTPIDSHSGLQPGFGTATTLHSQALLIANLWAAGHAQADWKHAAPSLWKAFLYGGFENNIDPAVLAELLGELGSNLTTIQEAIAYSAIDSGYRPFGDTALYAMFDDATDLGKILKLPNASHAIRDSADAISLALMQFAGQLAIGKVMGGDAHSATSGILDISQDESVLAIDFSASQWEAGADHSGIAGREALIRSALTTLGRNQGAASDLAAGMAWLWNATDTHQINRVEFATTNDEITRTLPSAGNIGPTLSLFVAGDANDRINGSEDDEIIGGGYGNDTIDGGAGRDLLIGGAGNDVLTGGDGHDFLAGGAGFDTVDIGSEWRATGAALALRAVEPGTADGRAAFELALDGDTDRAIDIERITLTEYSDTLTVSDLGDRNGERPMADLVVDLGGTEEPAFDDDMLDLSGAGRIVEGSFLGLPTATGTAGVRVDLRNTANQTVQQHSNWGQPPVIGFLTGNYYTDSEVMLRTANANSVTGTQYDDVLLGARGALGTAEGYSTLRGGAGNDFLAGAGWESHLYGGEGSDTFNLGSSTWVEDAGTNDRITYGIRLTGGVQTWWMEGNVAYWAAFSALTSAFPVIGSELLYTASFFMDQVTMKFARYKIDAEGNLLVDLWGQTAPSLIRDYHLNLDTGEATGGVVVFRSTAYSDESPAGHSRDGFLKYINLALKSGFGVGLGKMDPLVLDLDGDGYELATEQNGQTWFEFDGDDFAEHTGWIKGGDGFLVHDANANGTIDSLEELFGDAQTSGFTALAAFDTNSDGKVDAADANFAALQVWRDANMDGITQAGELQSLTALGIVSIGLANAAPAEATTVGDNEVVREGSFTRTDGTTGRIADIALAINETNTQYRGDTTVSSSAAALPELTGFGNVRNLRVAMTQDGALETLVEAFVATSSSDLVLLKAGAEAILYRWACVDQVAATALGADGFDMRKLAFLEAYSGYQLMPRGEGGAIDLDNLPQMEAMWADQLQRLTLRLVVQGPLADDFDTIHYDMARDMMIANDATALADLLHTRLEALPGDAPGASTAWAQWAPLLGALSEGMIRADANQVHGDYLFAQLVRAMDGVSQPLSLAELAAGLNLANLAIGTSGNDTLSRGSAEGTALYASGGGTDLFTGGGGQDVYVFGRAIGQATINDIEANPAGDRIRFAFLAPSEVGMARDGNDLLITVVATGETVRVVGQFAPVVPLGSDVLLSTNKGIEDIQFADGSVFEMPEIMAAVGKGTSAADHIVGTMHTDVLTGGGANDLLEGGDDADMYVFNRGDGDDIIIDQQTTPLLRGGDLIVFGDAIAPEDLVLSRTGANGENLLVTVAGGGGSALVQNQFAYTSLGYNASLAPNSRVEMVAFRHYGEAWTNHDIQQRLIEQSTSAGTDVTRGFGDDDHFAASAGNDLLIGMDGADTYDWGAGAGNDTIDEGGLYIDISVGLGGLNLTVRADTVQFGGHIALEDLVFSRPSAAPDLVITNVTTGETLTVRDQFAGFQTGVLGAHWFDRIEWFAFADGSRLSWQDVTLLITTGGAGDDSLWGDVMSDTLAGHAGNDMLSGLGGGDIYVFGLGDGHDTVFDNNTTLIGDGFVTIDAVPDILDLGPGIAPQDIGFERNGTSIDLVIGTGGDRVTLSGQNDYFQSGVFGALSYHRLEQIRFDDGTIWTWEELNARVIAANTTSGDDIAEGFALEDRFEASAGNDTMRGGDSGDTYVFGTGSGHDRIEESVTNVLYGDGDIVEFTAGVLPSDVSVARDGNDLVLTLAGGDSLTVAGEFAFGNWFTWEDVEFFRFANGVEWTKADIQVRLLTPTAGNDHLVGFMTDDQLDGGAGDDLLEGADGSDTYHFGIGSGHDEIRETLTNANLGDFDRLVFGAGVTLEHLHLARDGDALIITIAGSGDSVRIAGQFQLSTQYHWHDIEEFEFADGSIIGKAALQELLLLGSPDDDHLIGFATDDLLDGGAGNDILEGADGSDTYRFGIGSGQDEIREWLTSANLGEFDRVVFGAGVDVENLGLARDGYDLVITIAGTGDTLRIAGQFNNSAFFTWNDIEEFEFANGSVLTKLQVQQMLLVGTSGDDHMVGFVSDDLLDGGAGNDLLEGRDGGDTYVFDRGYGQDEIRESVSYVLFNDQDKVAFGAGILPADLAVARSGSDLILTVVGTSDSLTITGEFANQSGYTWTTVESFTFTDGTVWTKQDVQAQIVAALPTSGDDVSEGFDDGDLLLGLAGNDVLIGKYGNDILVGGTGDDVLHGNGNDDIYRFALGDGHDVIRDDPGGWGGYGNDRVELGAGITPGDVSVSQVDGAHLLLSIAGGDTVLLQQTIPDGNGRIEEVRFADGTIWTHSVMLAMSLGATQGDDSLNGDDSANLIDGLGGNDALGARGGNDTLYGREGNDLLWGEAGNDLLDGGTGDDAMSGAAGDDVYVFGLDGGVDAVHEYAGWGSWGGNDRVELGAGIAPGDVTVTASSDWQSLTLSIAGTSDAITLVNTINNSDYRVESVRFADGTVWTHADLISRVTTPTAGNDDFYGTYDGETLAGGGGNDSLHARGGDDSVQGDAGDDWLDGGNGNDVVIGGTGTDFLSGGGGNDIFRFARGDGDDTIRDYVDWGSGWAGNDRIEFAIGIAPGDVTVTQIDGGTDLLLTVNAGGGSLRLEDTITSSDNRIDEVRFADGTVWNAAELLARATAPTTAADHFYGGYDGDAISGGAGDDWIDGRNGSDILVGGADDDFLSGGGGNDVYRFGAGDGSDQVRDYIDWNSGWGGTDAVELAAGIGTGDVTLYAADGNRDLVIEITATGDRITLDDTRTGSDYRIEELRFADGTVWSYDGMISHLADFTAAADTLTGTAGADVLRGGPGSDTLNGATGDDVLAGDQGNDTIDGGDGVDAARFRGQSFEYTVEATSTGYRVIDFTADRDGTDLLAGIEQLAFADGSFDLADRLDRWADVPASAREDATTGTVVGTFVAAGAAGFTGTVAYALADDAGGRFAIDAATGAVTYTGAAPLEASAEAYALTVRVSFDGAAREVDAAVAVENVNLAPSGLAFEAPLAPPQGLVGSASLTGSGWYQLTPNSGGQTGAVWGRVDLDHNAQWDTRVYFGGSDGGADGVSFALQNAGLQVSGGTGALTALSLGILFDTYSNSGEPNSDFSQIVLNNQPSTGFDGRHLHANLENSGWHDVSIRWDAATSTLSYSLDGVAVASKSHDLAALFGDAPAFWGFGGATGGAYNEQRVELASLRAETEMLSVSENAAAGTVVAYLDGVDGDAGDNFTFAITDTAGNAVSDANFEITGSTLRVKTGASIDFEAAASLDLHVKVTDVGGLSKVVAVSVAVVNQLDGAEAPGALRLSVPVAAPSSYAGSASHVSGNVYQLTPNQGGQNGAVWGAVDLASDVTWTTRVYFGGSDGGADGVSFALQSDSATALGAGALTGNSLGIVFDTYVNNGEPNSDFSQFVLDNNPSFAFDAFHTHGNLENGGWHDVVIVWDADTQTLSYALDGQHVSARHFDVIGDVFSGATTGYYGFGARTGGATNTQQVEVVAVETAVDGFALSHQAAAGTLVGLLAATDRNGDAVSFTIVDANGTAVSDALFEISGRELRVKSGASLVDLGATTHMLLVKAADSDGASRVTPVEIRIDGSANSMTGSSGDDSFVVDDEGDQIVEAANGGTDGVVARVTFTLPDHVENLALQGTSAIAGTGNALANMLVGNAGANALSGGAGDDSIDGGPGADLLTGGSGSDQFCFSSLPTAGVFDTIADFVVGEDRLRLDPLIFSAAGGPGTLAASAFRAGATAQDSDDRILYDVSTGRIYYDADGSDVGDSTLFASVTPGLALNYADVLL